MIWILKAFHTFPSTGIEAIAELIPIVHHLQKLSGRNQLHTATLPHNHKVKELLKRRFTPLSP